MDVSVIIVNYNTKALTQQCIESVFEKTTGVEFEVIVVDNGSTDGSREAFEGDSRLHYIYSVENLGFGRANNLGNEIAKGEYLFLLNSDTYLLNNAIYLLWKQLEDQHKNGDSTIACAGAMLLNRDNEIIHSYSRFPKEGVSLFMGSIGSILIKLRLMKNSSPLYNYKYEKFANQPFFYVDYITGADLMIRRSAAQSYGLFDPDFFMYYEETEMQFRYMKHNLKRIIVNSPQIVHLVGKSNTGRSLKSKSTEMESMFTYYRKTRSRFNYFCFSILYKILYVTTAIICFPFVRGRASEKLALINHVVGIR